MQWDLGRGGGLGMGWDGNLVRGVNLEEFEAWQKVKRFYSKQKENASGQEKVLRIRTDFQNFWFFFECSTKTLRVI